MTWNQFKCVTLKLFFLGSFFSIHWLNLYDLVIEQCNLWYYDSFLNSKPNKFIQTDFWTWNKIKKNVNFLCVKIMFKIYFDDDNKTHNLCRWITVLFLVFIFCFRLRLLPPMRTWLWDKVLCFVCFCFSCDFFCEIFRLWWIYAIFSNCRHNSFHYYEYVPTMNYIFAKAHTTRLMVF